MGTLTSPGSLRAFVIGCLATASLLGCHRPPTTLPVQVAPAGAATEPAAGTPGGSTPTAAASGLAARTRVGGFAGLRTYSRVSFAAEPERPHVLSASYSFPDLVRLELSVEGGGPSDRVLTLRFGTRLFELAPGSTTSSELEPEVRLEQLRRMELRRAALLWPDGLAWEQKDGSRFARLPDLGEALGFLVASEFNGELPGRIDVHRPDGQLQEALVIEAWQTQGTRSFPSRLAVHFGSEVVWTESIERLETNVLFREALFVPADRLELLPIKQRVARGSVPRASICSFPLLGQRSWETARQLESSQRSTLTAALPSGLGLEPELGFDLAADGLPAAAHWRLTGNPAHPLPAGFLDQPAAQSLQVEVDSLEAISPADLETLRALMPAGAQVQSLQALLGTDQRVHVRLTYR